MKLKNIYFFLLVLVLVGSCKKDDDNDIVTVPPRLLSEVAAENDEEIVAFLSTHFYNYEEFTSPAADFDYKIKFDTIAGENSDKDPIIERPELIVETISVPSSDFGRSDGEIVDHKLYTLVAFEGVGDKPTIGDRSILQYEGIFLNGVQFDAADRQPTTFYLSDPGLRLGFARGVINLNTGGEPVLNVDGTVSFEDFGVGTVFMPSGLAYFDDTRSGIPSYSPLVFNLSALSYVSDFDFDGDGIPSILEDVNNDGNLNNDNTDEDTEPITIYLANHNDTDDDADGIPTIEEINLKDDGSFDSFRDTDGDGIFDHLDNDDL